MQSILPAAPVAVLPPPAPAPLLEALLVPHTDPSVVTVAAMLRVCDHPADHLAVLDQVDDGGGHGLVRLTWCGLCGAMATTPVGQALLPGDFIRTSLATTIGRNALADVEDVFFGLREVVCALEFLDEHARRALGSVESRAAHRTALAEIVATARDLAARAVLRSVEGLGPVFAAIAADEAR